MSFTFNTCHSIVCEVGASRQLAGACTTLNVRRPLLVTDPGLVAAGVVQPIFDALVAGGVDPVLYSDVQADPPESVVLDAAGFAREAGIDGVIGLGGGSSMDVAKLIAVLAGDRQPLQSMYGVDNITGQRVPLIQVPTTAGTGSEVTPVSIITTGETTKSGVVSTRLLPDIAILDAALTVALPAAATAATGIDAMVHAIEAYTSRIRKNPYSDMLARRALELMSANLVTAVDNGANLAAREAMLLGAMLAGQAFANAPVGAVHALAYPLGGHYHIPHGLSNSLVLPPVLRFNARCAFAQYAELAPLVGACRHGTTSAADTADAFIATMEDLIRQVGLPTSLAACDVAQQDLPMLARDAMEQQRLLVNNPREVTESDALALYNEVY